MPDQQQPARALSPASSDRTIDAVVKSPTSPVTEAAAASGWIDAPQVETDGAPHPPPLEPSGPASLPVLVGGPPAETQPLLSEDGFIPPRQWQPSAFTGPNLISLCLFSCILIAILYVVHTTSERNGGLLFDQDIEGLPWTKTFLHKYAGIILATFYSFCWSWIDLDVRRLEPFHQLSQQRGALGRDSLLLHYPVDFLATVPIRSIRRGHWAVFWSSTAVVFAFWAITPLQAGVFSTNLITRTTNVATQLSESSAAVDIKAAVEYGYSAFSITMLNESLPPFMTRDYAIAPFRPERPGQVEPVNGTLSASTRAYTLDLRCEKIDIPQQAEKGGHFRSNITGCDIAWDYIRNSGCNGKHVIGEFRGGFSWPPRFTKEFDLAHKIQCEKEDYDWDDPQSVQCDPNQVHGSFLAMVAQNKKKRSDPPGKVVAMVCQPRYYRQSARAIVTWPKGEVLRLDLMEEKEDIPSDVYDPTMFASKFRKHVAGHFVRSPGIPVNQWPFFSDSRIFWNTITADYSPFFVTGISIGQQNRPLRDYLDNITTLQEAYQAGYRLLFAREMAGVLHRQPFEKSFPMTGELSSQMQAIQTVAPVVYVVMGLLFANAAISLALASMLRTRRWNLSFDPSSIASIMSLAADDEDLLAMLSDLDKTNDKEMEKSLGDKRFQLLSSRGAITTCEITGTQVRPDPADDTPRGTTIRAGGVRPIQFRTWSMLLLFMVQLAALLIFVLLSAISGLRGLDQPSKSPVLRRLVLDCIPTAFATFNEPFWIVISRLLCILRPFEELLKGNASPQKSLLLNYSSLPPQLLIPRAIKARHFGLVMVFFLPVLGHVLAGALGALFVDNVVESRTAATSVRPFLDEFVQLPFKTSETQFFRASNLTSNVSIPPWTDESFMYVPFFNHSIDSSQLGPETFEAEVQAFGMDLECTSLEPDEFSIVQQRYALSVEVNAPPHVEGASSCDDQQMLSWLDDPGACPRNGRSALEFLIPFSCSENFLVAGWARYEGEDACRIYLKKPLWFAGANSTIESMAATTVIRCRPMLRSRVANVTVSGSGRILSSTVSSQVDKELSPALRITAMALYHGAISAFIGNRQYDLFMDEEEISHVWHKDSVPSDWFHYFITSLSGTRLIDPALPPPPAAEATDQFVAAYRRMTSLWLGINLNRLFVSNNDTRQMIKMVLVKKETRVFLAPVPRWIATVILSLNGLAIFMLYIRRPGRFLPRMPTNLGSLITMFAASSVVVDMRNTLLLSPYDRAKHVENLRNNTFAYGTYSGPDERRHIGIDRSYRVSPAILRKGASGAWLLETGTPVDRTAEVNRHGRAGGRISDWGFKWFSWLRTKLGMFSAEGDSEMPSAR